MNNKTIPVEKIRDLIHHWEEIIREEPRHINDAEFLNDLRDLLPPPPLPGPLFLAKATHSEYGEGVVTSHFPDGDGTVRFMFTDEAIIDGTSYHWVFPSDLTFHTPDHPEFLETEEDYENAPEGTIVAADDYWPFARFNSGWITSTRPDFGYGDMAGIRRRVLRWGWPA